MNLKVTVTSSTPRVFAGTFPPTSNFYASPSLVGTFLGATKAPEGVVLESGVHVVAHQGPASGAGAVIVSSKSNSPLALKEVRLEAESMVLLLSWSQPLPYGCSAVMRYGTQALQPSIAAVKLLNRFTHLLSGGLYTLVDTTDQDRNAQLSTMAARLAALTFIPNWPKHETQGSSFIVPGMLPHAVGAAFSLIDAAEAFATWADQSLLWRPIANGMPPKSVLYPTLCTAVDALGNPILQGDGKTPVPQTVPDPLHIQGQQLAWAWMLYGDAPAAVELMWLWKACREFNVYANPDKEQNPRAFGRVGEFTFWMAVACPDIELRFEAQHYLKWLFGYLVKRAKFETRTIALPVIVVNYASAQDSSHFFNKVSTWMTASNGRAPALVIRHLELLDLLTPEDRDIMASDARELLELVANCMAHAVQLGLEQGVPFVRDYDDSVKPHWSPEVSGTDAWVLPTLRDVYELLPEYSLRELIIQGLIAAFDDADCLRVKVGAPPADLQAYEMLGIALDLMPSLGIKL